jgi:ABC-2 type transport system ATP-binding protein
MTSRDPQLAIRANGLVKDYDGLRAVDHLSFEVPAGVVAGFVGPNGAGKTTTIRMLLGLMRPSEGSAEVLGAPTSRPAEYLPHVGALIEGPAFYPTLSGRANLEALAVLGGFDRAQVERVLALVGLAERGRDEYRTYSLGMKQRLGIAAALLGNPRLLILDEPVNGLDPAGIIDVRTLLAELAATGVTVFVSSHLLAEVEQVAGWLVMLKQGRLLYDGPATEALALRRGVLVVACENGAGPNVVAALAREAGYEVAAIDGSLRIAAPPEFAGELNRRAMQAGVTLTELHFRRPSLEEAFFALTEDVPS